MKYFKTSDDDINAAISRTVGLPDSAAQPFTVSMYARAYSISVTTANKRIRDNPNINEISKTRASELGFTPEARDNTERYNVVGESLTLPQIQAKYNIPKTTLRQWKNNQVIEERIKMLSQRGYTNHLLSEGVITSIWKYDSGNLQPVPVKDILYKIDDDDRLHNNLVTAYNVTEVMNNYSHLRLFYSVILDVFKNHQSKFGSTLRGIKLQFIPNSIKAIELNLNQNLDVLIPKQEDVLKTTYQIEPEVLNTAFSITRYLNVLKVQMDHGPLVEMVDFEEFARRIAGFTVGENFGSDSDNGESILQGYRMVTSQFIAIVEKTSLGRAVLRSLVKNTRSKVYKHPYYNLLEPDRSIGENGCFFDSIKTWCKVNGYKEPSILKEVYSYNKKGVGLDDLNKICLILGIHLQVYGNPENLKEVLIGEYGCDKAQSEYEESVKIYFTLSPEPHFTALIGVKEKLHTCYICNNYHQTQQQLGEHRKKYHPTECNKKDDSNSKKVEAREVVLLYYDIETVNNPETLDVEVYSVAWKWSMEEQINCALESKHTKNPMDEFVEDIHHKCLKENIDIRMIAFNGSSFDLYPTLKKLGEYFNFKSCIYKASRFYSVEGVSKGNPKSIIRTWDPYLLFRGKLSSILTSFGIESEKEEFNHVFIQQRYMEEGRNFDWIKGSLKRKIISYNKQDVKVLEELVEKILQVIPNALSHLTASSLSFAEFKNKCLYSKKIEKTMSETTYHFIRKAIVGGRVQTHHKYTTSSHCDEPLAMIDVVSLYPSQMVGNKYPIGAPIETCEEVKGKMGVYDCQINFQKLPVIVPRRREGEPLDWNYCGSMSCTLSSITIKQLRKHFGKASVTVFGGYYWEKSVTDLFDGFVNHWIEVKKAEDKKKNLNKPYNKALRETAKLILNSAFGKMIQKVIEDETNLISNAYSLRTFKEKFNSGYDLFQVSPYIDLIKGKLRKVDYTTAKPQHIGLFILDYTKKKMYNEIFSQTTVYYSDTDSALILRSELIRLQREGILKIGSGLGEYDIEMDDIVTFHSIEPKSYALISSNGDVKMRMKGVNLNSAWSNGEVDENGEVVINPKICLKAYENIIKNRRDIRFYTTCFSHKREGLKVYGEDRVKEIRG
jgi:hypothetical protein